MRAPLSMAALFLLGSASLSSQATAQLSVTTHVPTVACLLLIALDSSLTAAQLSVVRGEVDEENEVDDEVENKDDDGDDDDDGENEDEDEDEDEDDDGYDKEEGDEDEDEDDEDEDEDDFSAESAQTPAVTPSSTATNVDFTASDLSCPDSLDQSTQIDSGATLFYAVVPSNPAGSGNGLFCGRLEAEDDGWIGIGFSSDGTMYGSQAVIGIPVEATVLKYDLTSTATLMSEERQTLSGTSITEIDGMMIMKFAKLLTEEGEVPILLGAKNDFIHARGLSELGFHTIDVAFHMDLSNYPIEGDVDEVIDIEGDDGVTPSSLVGDAESSNDCTRDMCEIQLSPDFFLKYQINVPSDTTLDLCEDCSISMEAIYDGEAWVSIAFTTDGMMTGSEAVM